MVLLRRSALWHILGHLRNREGAKWLASQNTAKAYVVVQKHVFVGGGEGLFALLRIQGFVKPPPSRFLGNPVANFQFRR